MEDKKTIPKKNHHKTFVSLNNCISLNFYAGFLQTYFEIKSINSLVSLKFFSLYNCAYSPLCYKQLEYRVALE